MTKKITVIIEKGRDNYGAYSGMPGVHGAGDTVDEAKQSVEESIRLFKMHNDAENIPVALKGDYELVYQFDMQSFFDYYKNVFTKAGLEKLTGINQRQLQHYASGHRRPRPAQTKKLETALHKLGAELLALQF